MRKRRKEDDKEVRGVGNKEKKESEEGGDEVEGGGESGRSGEQVEGRKSHLTGGVKG